MRAISRRSLFARAAQFPDARSALQTWFFTATAGKWKSLNDVRAVYPSTDMVGDPAVFNIRGNHYRLIVRMAFDTAS